jgi:hypothetical protein
VHVSSVATAVLFSFELVITAIPLHMNRLRSLKKKALKEVPFGITASHDDFSFES